MAASPYTRPFWGLVLAIIAFYGLLNAYSSRRSVIVRSSEVSTPGPTAHRHSRLLPLQRNAVCDTREARYREQEMSQARLANVNEVIRDRRAQLGACKRRAGPPHGPSLVSAGLDTSRGRWAVPWIIRARCSRARPRPRPDTPTAARWGDPRDGELLPNSIPSRASSRVSTTAER